MNTYEYIWYNHSNSTISSDTSPLAMVVYHLLSSYIQTYLERHPWADPIPCQNMGICPIARHWLSVAKRKHPQKSSSRDPDRAAFPDFQHASAHQKPSSLTPMAAYGPYGCFSKLGLVPQPGDPWLQFPMISWHLDDDTGNASDVGSASVSTGYPMFFSESPIDGWK